MEDRTIMTRITIREEVQIPGTDIMLEKGDRIVVAEKKQSNEATASKRGSRRQAPVQKRGNVEKVTIRKDVRIPGTDIILEKGDKVTIKGNS